MAVLGWGKCSIFAKDLETSGAKWFELPTPAENTTQLATTKGDKKEAKVEGGENEDVRYNKNSYALNFTIRAAKNRKRPFDDADGIIGHNYAIAVLPEDAECTGILMDKCRMSVEDGFSTDEGGMWAYTADALKPDSGTMVKWGVINVSKSGSEITGITCTPIE